MAQDSEVQTVLAELRRYGIKPIVRQRGSGHVGVVWRLNPNKPEREIIVAATGGDWRGRLNARADTRRYLKADGAELLNGMSAPKQGKFQHALSAPPAVVDSIPDQLADIRSVLDDLQELLLASHVPTSVAPVEKIEQPPQESNVVGIGYSRLRKGLPQRVLKLLQETDGTITSARISEALSANQHHVINALCTLRNRGLAKRVAYNQWSIGDGQDTSAYTANSATGSGAIATGS